VIAMTGPDHRRLFTTQVLIGEKVWGQGSGSTKQAAAQEAARVALETIG
jgi:ribonuclease-3